MENKFLKFDNELISINRVGGLKLTARIENGKDLFEVILTDLNDKNLHHIIASRDYDQTKRIFDEVADKLGYIEF